MEVQGWVVVALALVVLGYLLPHLVRSREQLAQARVDDRFSESLRVVATAGRPRRAEVSRGSSEEARPYLHSPRRGTEASTMERPMTRAALAAEQARLAAAERAARAARISRRRAAARRRLILATTLLVLTIAGWLGTGFTSLPVVAAIVPTVLLAAVLVAGRRAAIAAARNTAADHAAMAALEISAPPREAPRADTAATPAVETEPTAESEAPAQPTEVTKPGAVTAPATTWTPQPVPLPSYQLKAPAPRRDVVVPEGITEHGVFTSKPATTEQVVATEVSETTATVAASETPSAETTAAVELAPAESSERPAGAAQLSELALEDSPYGSAPRPAAAMATPAEDHLPEATAEIDVDAVLARRRAVGA